MNSRNTISIDGIAYDAITGLPSNRAKHVESVVHRPGHTPATVVHSQVQKSSTLHRRATKKPVPLSRTITHSTHKTHVRPVPTHHQVRKFAPHPMAVAKPKPAQGGRMMDFGPARPVKKAVAAPAPQKPILHPHVAKAHAKSYAKAVTPDPLPMRTIKEEAIKNAIENTEKKPPLKKGFQWRNKLVSLFSGVLAIVLLGGYFTYLNMPNISVRVAAMQAGIDANYPAYNPDGYSLAGPVKYTDGRVTLSYNSNAGPHKYKISQTRSDWNSDAVLDNYVNPRAGANYIPYTERGLTIYTYDNNAAWVNGGILYTLEGDAPLSSEQIRRIATSLL